MYKVQEINESFLLNESREQAYLLGYITGDGCLHGGNILQIDSSDKQIIEEFSKRLNAKIYEQPNLKKGSYRIQIHSDIIRQYLSTVGLCERKSYSGISEINVDKEYYADFIRGWVDSDGTIYKSGRKEYPAPGVELFISVYGNEVDIASGMLDYLGLKYSVKDVKNKTFKKIAISRR